MRSAFAMKALRGKEFEQKCLGRQKVPGAHGSINGRGQKPRGTEHIMSVWVD